jgi:hypothetical protein
MAFFLSQVVKEPAAELTLGGGCSAMLHTHFIIRRFSTLRFATNDQALNEMV